MKLRQSFEDLQPLLCMQTHGKSGQSLAAVWDSLPGEQQLQLLTFDVKVLRSKACHVSGLLFTIAALTLFQGCATGVSQLRRNFRQNSYDLSCCSDFLATV